MSGRAAGPPISSSSARPIAANAIQVKSTSRREDSTASVSGPVISIASAMPSGTVRSDR